MKKNNKKGFTLAELLIVVAIIAVLVAVAIPVFTAQLEKSRNAANLSNSRAIYAQLVADFLDDNKIDDMPTGTVDGNGGTITVGGNIFKFQKVTSLSLTLPTDATVAPKVIYTSKYTTATDGTFGS